MAGMGKTVGDRMIRDVFTLGPSDTLRAAVEIVLQKHIRHLPIVDGDGHLLGIITDRDVKRALPSPLVHVDEDSRESLLDETPVARLMTKDPVTVTPATTLADAVRLLVAKKIGGLPVVEHGKLVGIFTEIDALKAFLETLDA